MFLLQADIKISDETIMMYDITQILSSETMDYIYNISDELERMRIKAILCSRAKELRIDKELSAVLKAYDQADKKLSQEYNRKNAIRNAQIILKLDEDGKVMNVTENYLSVLRHDDYFSNLKFNLLTYSPEKERDCKTVRWTDADDSDARNYIESKYRIHSAQKLDDALRILFREKEYHPIKQLLEPAKWDGKERIQDFFIKWAKCADNEYTREVSRLIFSGGINRLYSPGCKFDDVPVLIGTKQGEGKSTLVRWLAMQDDFFTEVCEIEGQRGMEALEGVWICEIAELLALTRTKEVEAVKSYITRQTDKYRRPFDKRVTEHKRQCVFIGTTNKEQFLTDKTGNRRFYPLKVYQSGYDLFDHEKEIKADILQCWAEAKYKYDRGEMLPYADKKLITTIKEHQLNAVEDDYRDGLIEAYLEDKNEVCLLEIWQKALDNGQSSKPSKKDSNDLALIVQALGNWERAKNPKRFPSYGLQKYWIKKEEIKPHEPIWEQLDNSTECPFQ